jgi:hypothetical protein
MNDSAQMDLSNIDGLNEQVSALFASLSASLAKHEDKASIGITLTLQRVKDTNSMITVTYNVKPTYPKMSHQIIAHTDLVGNLYIDGTPTQKNLFPMEVSGNE